MKEATLRVREVTQRGRFCKGDNTDFAQLSVLFLVSGATQRPSSCLNSKPSYNAVIFCLSQLEDRFSFLQLRSWTKNLGAVNDEVLITRSGVEHYERYSSLIAAPWDMYFHQVPTVGHQGAQSYPPVSATGSHGKCSPSLNFSCKSSCEMYS